ncbi:hypothetical protein BDN67DRAFT_357076 [Paxillus ammoniavirescens]|nr:hypothetical protein BDN67DRAFT_357076 [Paxillus ammoniavirescens]
MVTRPCGPSSLKRFGIWQCTLSANLRLGISISREYILSNAALASLVRSWPARRSCRRCVSSNFGKLRCTLRPKTHTGHGFPMTSVSVSWAWIGRPVGLLPALVKFNVLLPPENKPYQGLPDLRRNCCSLSPVTPSRRSKINSQIFASRNDRLGQAAC